MLNFITTYLVKPIVQRQFSINSFTEIDRYINSKNPQTVAEVEHWEKQFSRKQKEGWPL